MNTTLSIYDLLSLCDVLAAAREGSLALALFPRRPLERARLALGDHPQASLLRLAGIRILVL